MAGMNEAGECAPGPRPGTLTTVRCKLEISERMRETVNSGEGRDVVDEAADLFEDEDK